MYSSNPIQRNLIELDYKRSAAGKKPFLQSGGRISGEVPDVNAHLRYAMKYHGRRRSSQRGGILPALAAVPPALMAAAPVVAKAAGAVAVPVAVELALDKLRGKRKQTGSGFYRPRTKRKTIDSFVQMGGSMKHIKQAVFDSPHTKKLLLSPLVGATETLGKVLDSQLKAGPREKLNVKALSKSYGKRVGGEILKRAGLIARHPAAIHAITSNIKTPLFTKIARKAVRKLHHKATGRLIDFGGKLQRGAGIVPRMNKQLAKKLIMQDKLNKLVRAKMIRQRGSGQRGAGIGAVAGILGSSLLPIGFNLIKKQIGLSRRRRPRRRRAQKGGFLGLIPAGINFLRKQIGFGGVGKRRYRRKKQSGGLAMVGLRHVLPPPFKFLMNQVGKGRSSINKTSALPAISTKPALLPPIATRPATLPPTMIPATYPVLPPITPATKQSVGNRVLDKILAKDGIGDRVLNAAGSAFINKAFGSSKTTRSSTGKKRKRTTKRRGQ